MAHGYRLAHCVTPTHLGKAMQYPTPAPTRWRRTAFFYIGMAMRKERKKQLQSCCPLDACKTTRQARDNRIGAWLACSGGAVYLWQSLIARQLHAWHASVCYSTVGTNCGLCLCWQRIFRSTALHFYLRCHGTDLGVG